MAATQARFFPVHLLALALAVGMAERSALAQQPIGWAHGKDVYVSRGININRHWGTFVLYPGGKGKAIYIQDAPQRVNSVNLESIAPFPSSTVPWVHFCVYKELGSTRLWAFQIEAPTSNGYVIYFKDGGEPWQGGWAIYDFAD
jgi:hypothetical protein